MAIPVPATLASFFEMFTGNRSLLHARGMDQYDEQWNLGESKKKFLEVVAGCAHGREEYAKFIERRKATLDSEAINAACLSLASTSRLVCGLGLPHPAETSLLLDRLTGAPYLPGSSVKGMLRSAAGLAAKGEFPDDEVGSEDVTFWKVNLVRIFGPPSDGQGHAKWEMIFYDALPANWPTLEMDVLTPHYGEYYMDESGQNPPADWYSPIPVYFLAVKAGARFLFWYRGTARDEKVRKSDEEAIGRLLPAALDWLGIGAKKSSGYGWFGKDHVAIHASYVQPQNASPSSGGHAGERHAEGRGHAAQTRPVSAPKTETWKSCEVNYSQGCLCVFHGKKQTAFDDLGLLEAALKKKGIKVGRGNHTADVSVVKNDTRWRISAVLAVDPET